MLENPAINAIAIVTRHNTHAGFAAAALEQGKHEFVENPLALTFEELDQVKIAHETTVAAGNPPRLITQRRKERKGRLFIHDLSIQLTNYE